MIAVKKKKQAKDIAYFIIILILVLVILYSGLQILEATVLFEGTVEETPASKTIIRNGKEYFPRQDIKVIMVLGIDEFGPVQSSGSYINPGSADMVMLLILDEAEETCKVLQMNRDSMVEMPVLGVGGKEAGTYFGQLALSHTYGSGLHDSCKNTRKTLSNLLYGIDIHYYVAMNMDAISILNDAVGGVTVNVTDDFSEVDPSIGMGQVTLKGEQAIHFVRTRKDVGDQLNLSRVQRHREYVNGFAEALRAKQAEGADFILSAYEQVKPYMVTDCSTNMMATMIDRYSNYEIQEIVSPKGENVMSEKYFEFYIDEEDLDALILRLFYAEKE